ncbi:diiron oxygenase [Streptomyces parvus]|uniref:diiron oxygenase n=1 Tax=Streptomyces parvus TaxID=66428 RepID=UPI002100DF15|nr:diiron oxygenase [Streptomyces parvus]MCQ1575870.1 diiron oxygenase [Streptomyces parvus]
MLSQPAEDQVYFPPELVPVVSHPIVRDAAPGTVHRVLVERLFHYLHFTTELESVAVLPVTVDISRGRDDLDLGAAMREDAFKISTDETWHAQFSHDLMNQVSAETGIPLRTVEPTFLRRLEDVRALMEPELRGAQSLAFCIVSETLISAILADLPQDRRLPAAVRDLIRDHAEDEGRHHAYFRSVLKYFWHSLSPDQRRLLGPWLPELVTIFLEPDYPAAARSLLAAGLTTAQTEAVLAESYPAETVRASIADASRTTVRYFAEIGALDDPATLDAFHARGLTDGLAL